MKKILLFVVMFSLTSASLFANEYPQNYETAQKLKKEAAYQSAIKYLLKALKDKESDLETAQALCFEISDCYRMDGDAKSALKFVKVAVRNYGATKEDIETNTFLNGDFLRYAMNEIAAEYHDLHRIYLLKSNKFERKEYAKLME